MILDSKSFQTDECVCPLSFTSETKFPSKLMTALALRLRLRPCLLRLLLACFWPRGEDTATSRRTFRMGFFDNIKSMANSSELKGAMGGLMALAQDQDHGEGGFKKPGTILCFSVTTLIFCWSMANRIESSGSHHQLVSCSTCL
jgi:hypothetical protein